MYEYDVRIGFSQCDVDTTLNITALIDLLQDCSTFQSEDLGVGFDYLKKDNLVWVINYWDLQIKRLPKLCETVTVGTAPYDFKGFLGFRNFWLKDKEGNYLVKANSVWSLIDIKETKLMKASDELKAAYALSDKLDMEYNSRKVLIPNGEDVFEKAVDEITIQIHHLDSNRHVNNGQYVKLALSAIGSLDEGEPGGVKSLRIDYRKQAILGDVIYPVVYKSGNKRVAALNDAEGKPYSVLETEFS